VTGGFKSIVKHRSLGMVCAKKNIVGRS